MPYMKTSALHRLRWVISCIKCLLTALLSSPFWPSEQHEFFWAWLLEDVVEMLHRNWPFHIIPKMLERVVVLHGDCGPERLQQETSPGAIWWQYKFCSMVYYRVRIQVRINCNEEGTIFRYAILFRPFHSPRHHTANTDLYCGHQRQWLHECMMLEPNSEPGPRFWFRFVCPSAWGTLCLVFCIDFFCFGFFADLTGPHLMLHCTLETHVLVLCRQHRHTAWFLSWWSYSLIA